MRWFAPWALAAVVLVVTGCSSVTLWFAPDATCADWEYMTEEARVTLAEQLLDGDSLYEAVRIAQQAPTGTTEEQLVLMAASSVTKNCEIQGWSQTLLVEDIVRDLYAGGTRPT